MRLKSVNILGIPIYCESRDRLLQNIMNILSSQNCNNRYICAIDVHCIIESHEDINYRRILSNSYINYADGKPLKIFGNLLGNKEMEQIKGPEILPLICDLTKTSNISHFFYGGKEGVADQLADNFKKAYKGLKVAGTFCPPFRNLTNEEKNDIALKINNSGADIVWVGISAPKQEKWAADFQKRLNVKLIFTVGAAFDFHTGNIKFAPKWMCTVGLEWLHRLISEPKRLWPRYSRIVPKFLYLSLLQLFKINKYD